MTTTAVQADQLVRTDARTPAEIALDVRYGIQYNEMNARLYARLDAFCGFVGLFGGAAAFTTAFAGDKFWGMATGLFIAAFAVLERVTGPGSKALIHTNARRAYGALNVKLPEMQPAEIEKDLRTLQYEYDTGIASLARPAYNANVRANGRPDYAVPTTALERFIAFFA